jgi:tripartite-type tricarboxylate transporter receptor subunit TctC
MVHLWVIAGSLLPRLLIAGKTITIIRGGGAGGQASFNRAPSCPISKYIPGNPTIDGFMNGASGRKAANYFYTAKPDGLKIASAGAMIPGPIQGLSGSNYDIDKFPYIGSTETGNPYVFFTRKSADLDSLDKVRRTPGIRIGAHSVGHSVYVTARMFAYFLEFKDQVRCRLQRSGNGRGAQQRRA